MVKLVRRIRPLLVVRRRSYIVLLTRIMFRRRDRLRVRLVVLRNVNDRTDLRALTRLLVTVMIM